MLVKLRELRNGSNYTTKYMAERLKISKPYYCQIENCRRNLSYRMAINIASVFNAKPDDIFYSYFKEKE